MKTTHNNVYDGEYGLVRMRSSNPHGTYAVTGTVLGLYVRAARISDLAGMPVEHDAKLAGMGIVKWFENDFNEGGKDWHVEDLIYLDMVQRMDPRELNVAMCVNMLMAD